MSSVVTGTPTPATSSNTPEVSGNISLVIQSPSDNQVVSTNTVTVTGITTPQAEVSINQIDTTADAKGYFTGTINLDEGANIITIVVNDSNGNFIEKDINITYQIPS